MKKTEVCFLKVKNDYLKYLKKEKIVGKSNEAKVKILKKIYIPMSFWIENQYKKKRETLFIGLSGGQGSGKTMVAAILKIILKKFFKRETQVSSIDNFYKTLKERKKMSREIHPLFITRGVPGTHDTNIIKKFFYTFKKNNFKNIKLPKFDKSIDDRLKKKYWFNIKKKPEIVIFEGWCIGAKPQSKKFLKKPTNILEKCEDKSFKWRMHVNEKLKKEYRKIFNMIDYIIFMKVPNFDMILKWRYLQEKKLKKKYSSNKKIMSYNEIKRFIMHYERITLQMLKDLSKSASVVMLLKKNHEIKKVLFRL